MSEAELESIKKVDKVHELIQKLVNNNGHDADTFKEVDAFLNKNDEDKIGFDKTSINRSDKTDEISSQSFMQAIELDAKERAERKANNRKKAENFKAKANDYFKACDFKKAVDLYGKAIEASNDWDVLYTNRAQAFIKLNMAQNAIDDCDLALRLSDINHKALLHKGKSLVRLNRYEEAMECYKRVLELAPNLKKYMKEVFEEAEQLRQISIAKETSISAFECHNSKGDDSVDMIVAKLSSRGDEEMLFYSGGIQLLVATLSTNDGVGDCGGALSRLRCSAVNGTGLFEPGCKVDSLVGGVVARPGEGVSDTEWGLMHQWLDLLAVLVKDDPAFASTATQIASIHDCLQACLRWSSSMPPHMLLSVTATFYYLSCTDVAVQRIFDQFPLHGLLALVIKSMDNDRRGTYSGPGLALFRNLANSFRFTIALGKEEELVATVIDCLQASFASCTSGDCDQISSLVSVIESLSENSAIRLRLIKHEKFLNDCMATIEARVELSADQKHADILLKLFTFIHNLLVLTKAVPASNKVKVIGHRAVTSASAILSSFPTVEMRSILIQVLSHILLLLNDDQLRHWCQCPPVTCDSSMDDNVSMCRSLSRKSSLTDQNYLEKVCKPLRLCIAILDAPNHPLLSSAVKIITLASKVNEAVLFLCCDDRDRTLKLQSMIYKEKEPLDEVLAGNICLLLINSVNDTPLAEHLAHTTIIKDLLRVCADAKKNDCRRNAAILAGKLAQSSHLHKNELSRLNGFSIVSKFNSWLSSS